MWFRFRNSLEIIDIESGWPSCWTVHVAAHARTALPSGIYFYLLVWLSLHPFPIFMIWIICVLKNPSFNPFHHCLEQIEQSHQDNINKCSTNISNKHGRLGWLNWISLQSVFVLVYLFIDFSSSNPFQNGNQGRPANNLTNQISTIALV